MKIEKIIIHALLIIFVGNLFSLNVYSQDSVVPCFNPDGGLGTMGLASYNCPLAKTVANEPKTKEAHENKILEKLADKLALKATQRLEEIALLDQYFSQNNKDLMMNSIEVEKKCKLETISTPRCGPKTNLVNYKKKLEMLLGRFPESKDGKNTLYSRMRTKFSEMRGAQVNDNKCPISGTSGFFFISSQLTESDAVNFIDSLKDSRQTEVGNLYESFPQLKMLKNSIKNGPNGERILADFEKNLKTYNDKGSAKDFINSFLFTNANQEEMAKGLAFQCSAITDNISEFLCDDLDSFGMPEKFASEYFTGPGSEIDIAVSKGLSCDTKKSSNGQLIEDEDKLTKGKSIFSLQKKFLDDSRPVKDDLIAKRNAGQFCDIYLCKSEASKNLKSCTSGGPVSSTDLLNSYCLDSKAASCNNKYLSYISYLASLEKDKKEIYEPNQSIASGSKDITSKAKSYSSFYQNFLGVEGTLLAEGKAITPVTVAEKKAEFVEKKLDPTPQVASLTQQPKETAKIERDDSFSREEKPDFVSSPAPERDNDQFRKSFNAAQFAKASAETPLASNKSKKMVFDDGDSARMEEMKQLRGELADAISKVKGTNEERLAAVADNNAVAITPKGSTKDTTRNLSPGEKDRLDSYRESLNNWEGRLRNWQGQLSDREVRGNSGNVAGVVEPRAAGNGVDQSNSAGTSSNNIKLTKTSTGAAGSAGGKAETGDRAPGAEKADADAGVVNSENLATLQKDSLKKLGIVASDSFIIKVRFQDKIYSIPVKTFNHDGKSMYVPLLNDKNRELSKIVYESPLFKDYREYQIERQYKLEKK